MSRHYETITAIVARTHHDQHWLGRGWVDFSHSMSTGQSSQLHQLDHTIVVAVEQLHVHIDGLLLVEVLYHPGNILLDT